LSAASEPVSDGAVEEAVARAAGMLGGVEGARIEDRNVPIEGGDIEG
jgi:flavin-binding protein dodecin